jgi:SNF2 family DNA or RNA helicase
LNIGNSTFIADLDRKERDAKIKAFQEDPDVLI